MAIRKRKKEGDGEEAADDAPNEWTPAGDIDFSGAMRPKDRPAPPPVPSFVGALCTTLFCCPPLGLLALFLALQVGRRWRSGDEAGARYVAERSEFWMYIGVASGGLIWVAGIAFRIYKVKTGNQYGL